MFIQFYLMYVRHFPNTIVFFGPFWRPLWLSALGSRLLRLMVTPALGVGYCILPRIYEILRNSLSNYK